MNRIFALSLMLNYFLTVGQVPHVVLHPQGHTGRIPNLLFTPDGKKLVSVSEDKTIKVWKVSTGDLLKTYGSETGDGYEGMFYTSAMGPAGKWICAAGYQVSSQQENYILFIDLEKGTQVATARGHSDVINALSVNAKGTLLASGSQDGTIRLWKVDAYPAVTLYAIIKTGAPVLNLAFHPSTGDLAVSGEGGDVAVYQTARIPAGESTPAPKILRRHKAMVTRLAYSPDGSVLASTALSGELTLWNAQGTPTDLIKGKKALTSVAWAPDSRMLVVLDEEGVGMSLTIPAASILSEQPIHDNTVFSSAFSPLANGTYVVASGGGTNHEIILWNPVNGSVVRKIKGKGNIIGRLAFGSNYDLFYSSTTHVGARTEYQGYFDLQKMQVSKKVIIEPEGRIQSKTIYQTSEQVIEFGKGKTIQTDPFADGRIFDFMQLKDGSVIVASEFSLKQFSSGGAFMREFVGHNGTVRTITASSDGRYLASGGDDQVIHLWLLGEQGGVMTMRHYFNTPEWSAYFSTLAADSLTHLPRREAWLKMISLLKAKGDKAAREIENAYKTLGDQAVPFVSLFVTDDQEWVCWSPEGYFACSTSGSRYFGWQINHGIEKLADFYEAGQYYEILYRPREMRASLNEGRRIESVLRAQGVPIFDLTHLFRPSVASFEDYLVTNLKDKINNVNGDLFTAESSLPMEVNIYDGGGGVRELVIYRNDKLVYRDTAVLFPPGSTMLRRTYDLALGNKENVFRIKTINRSRVESRPEEFIVNYSGKPISNNTLFILAVGINKYTNSTYDLNYARPDAESFVQKMGEVNGNIYRNIVVKELYDQDASRNNIISELNRIAATSSPDDVFVFYYAGHGVVGDEENAEFFLVPSDVTKMFDTPERLRERGISANLLKEAFIRIRAQKQVVMMDACHSGAAMNTLKFRAVPTEEKAINMLARSSGIALLASSGSQQFAAEFEQLRHGTFTYALLEGLSGKADQGDGQITVNELIQWMDERVPELTTKYGGKAQYPRGNLSGNDFPVGVSAKT